MAHERIQRCLDRFAAAGANVVALGSGEYRLEIEYPRSISDIGGWLYHSYMKHLCTVIGTTGAVESRAGAYPKS